MGRSRRIEISQVRNGLIQLVQTKSSKGRAIPISVALENEIHQHHKNRGDGERCFMAAYFAFRKTLIDANLKHSEGQLTHILRHTFASHFMMNGGNVIALQKILGHHSLIRDFPLALNPNGSH